MMDRQTDRQELEAYQEGICEQHPQPCGVKRLAPYGETRQVNHKTTGVYFTSAAEVQTQKGLE